MRTDNGTKLDYFSSWSQHDVLGTPRRGMRRPSLGSSKVGLPAAPKSGGLKRSNEFRSQALPTLNLAKIKQNLEQQQQQQQQEESASSSQDLGKDESFEPTGTQSTPASSRGDRRNYLLKRSAKESPLFNALAGDYGGDHATNKGYHAETARFTENREKLAKYSYPYSVTQLMSSSDRKFNGDSYAVKNGSMTTRNFQNNNDREPSESRLSGGLNSEVDNAKTKKSESTLQAKKLSLRLVSSLEEALAKVSKPDWEARKLSLHLTKDPFSVTARTNQDSYPSVAAKFHGNLHYLNLKDEKHSQEDAAKMSDSYRLHEDYNSQGSHGAVSKDRADCVKVKSLKLPVDKHSSAVPLGFGGNPVECVQTARLANAISSEQNPRLAVADRSRRTLSSYQRRKKTDAPTFPSLPPGVLATPEIVLKQCSSHMSEYEHQEILPYQEVFFIGANSHKIQTSSTPGNCNYGYDDDRGDYLIVERDHLAYRYEIVGILGKGSFGQVLKCIDHKLKSLRAVKVIRNKKRFHQQALIEVKILEHLRDKATEESANYNIVTIHESFYFRGHLCITFELHDISLYDLIKKNNFQGISMAVIRDIAIQVLQALKFLRKLHVIHCDLKPENILLHHPSSSKIKVIDFGSSCFEHEKIYTYIQSRFYRSPEVILGLPYDVMIDVWSFGCILAELCSGCPLFPGENEVEQLACMMEILGTPPDFLLENATRKKMFFDSSNHPRIVPNSWGKKYWPGTKNLSTALRCNNPLFINFLECCLRWDRNQRMTPDDLLQHAWILEVPTSANRLPLQPSNQDTSKRRSMKSSETPHRSFKQSKQNSTSVVKSHLKLSNLGKCADVPNVLPPIGEALTFRTLQERKKAV
ncbi:probable serine/threonine-protein kinase dyrk2 [Selaginella moellendorffii]|uniref:probable serine/threonine-protein kinase dyrk2 n=1 Tax=Selaginella moellendorffii TaxID=88036 RepID=UPI000D1CB95D|nr:probable serine/threonine-protein kinase dyrk2 [Selaginella moellendorffii]|eukprot:XP_002961220.2 probable serine/threonine-protein kinase dyrk2 [Selaginella moellendorffii]